MGASEPLLDAVLKTHPREFEVLTPNDKLPDTARKPAADLIIETLLTSRERVIIVAIGPLTNIALALRTEPRIKEHIDRIVLMGGAYLSSKIEYNVKRDPVAAQIVFRSGVPITAVGLDVTEPCKMRQADLDKLRSLKPPSGRFLARLVELSQAETGEKFPTLYDPLAMAVVFRPDLIETAAGSIEVSLAQDSTRGQTKFTADPNRTTRIGVKVNAEAFLGLFRDRLR